MHDPANVQAWHRAIEFAAGSIRNNIAEEAGRPSAADCARFFSYAISSALEVESHPVLADRLDLELPGIGDAIDEARQVRRMTYGFRQHSVRKAANEKTAARTKEASRESDLPPPPCLPSRWQLPALEDLQIDVFFRIFLQIHHQ